MTTSPVRQRIEEIIRTDRVVLFMKGTRYAPSCGFSATVVDVLDGILPQYTTVNVLTDAAVREEIKAFSEWPTIPQLFIDGTFVGGADIVKEMAASGDLHKALGVERTKPNVSLTLTETARDTLSSALVDAGDDVLRLKADARFDYDLFFGPKEPDDVVAHASGIAVHMDLVTARRVNGTTIDYLQGASSGFKLDNPNEPPKVLQLSAVEAKAKLGESPPPKLLDVRSEQEWQRARIDGATRVTPELIADLEDLPRDTPLVFVCHHGVRSQAAAEHFTSLGFRRVWNLQGGIDAWSLNVDATVPRY